MNNQQFSIEIQVPKEKVWNTLWEDTTFRDWANNIDEGMYLKGELKEGDIVQFMSSVSGYGVSCLVEKLIPNEFISFRHMEDTKENGTERRDDEWTGGVESYSLHEQDGVTTVTVITEVPPELKETIEVSFPKALKRLKELAERN